MAQNNERSQHIAADSHITFVPPREINISSKVRVAISEINQPRATAMDATGIFTSIGNVSPKRDHEIGPKPKLKAAKKRLIQVGDIQ